MSSKIVSFLKYTKYIEFAKALIPFGLKEEWFSESALCPKNKYFLKRFTQPLSA